MDSFNSISKRNSIYVSNHFRSFENRLPLPKKKIKNVIYFGNSAKNLCINAPGQDETLNRFWRAFDLNYNWISSRNLTARINISWIEAKLKVVVSVVLLNFNERSFFLCVTKMFVKSIIISYYNLINLSLDHDSCNLTSKPPHWTRKLNSWWKSLFKLFKQIQIAWWIISSDTWTADIMENLLRRST